MVVWLAIAGFGLLSTDLKGWNCADKAPHAQFRYARNSPDGYA